MSLKSIQVDFGALFRQSRHLVVRHAVISISCAAIYVLLNRPEIILFSRIGVVAWYPAVGLVMSLMVGVSPAYAPLVCVLCGLVGRVIYGQPFLSFSNTIDPLGVA